MSALIKINRPCNKNIKVRIGFFIQYERILCIQTHFLADVRQVRECDAWNIFEYCDLPEVDRSLADVDLAVLGQIIRLSYAATKEGDTCPVC